MPHDDISYDDIMAKDILDILGLVDITDEEKIKLKAIMEETIKNRIIARVIDSLSDEDTKLWGDLKTAEEKIDFLKNHNLSLEKIALEEALIYKYEMAKLVQEMQKHSQK